MQKLLFRERLLNDRAEQLFGVHRPLAASSRESITAAEANRDPTALVTLAGGLRAHVVSAATNLGPNVDMMALWPDDSSPTHLIFCNEEGAAQPGVQRVRLDDGTVETILTGTISCDPSKRTPWGTIIVGEENGNTGWLIEIIDPLHTTGVLFNRTAGTFSGGVGAMNLAVRPAVGRTSFEGIGLYPATPTSGRDPTPAWGRGSRSRARATLPSALTSARQPRPRSSPATTGPRTSTSTRERSPRGRSASAETTRGTRARTATGARPSA